LEHFLLFHSVGNVIIPTDFHSIIFRGVGGSTTNQMSSWQPMVLEILRLRNHHYCSWGSIDTGGFGNGILRFDSSAALRASVQAELKGAFGEDRRLCGTWLNFHGIYLGKPYETIMVANFHVKTDIETI